MSVELGWVSPDTVSLASAAVSVDAMERDLLRKRPEFTQLDSNVRRGGWMQIGLKVPGDISKCIDSSRLVDSLFYATVGRGCTTIRTWVGPGQSVVSRFNEVFGSYLDVLHPSFLLMEATLGTPGVIKPQFVGIVSNDHYGTFWTSLVGYVTKMVRQCGVNSESPLAPALQNMSIRGDQGGYSAGEAIGHAWFGGGENALHNHITCLPYSLHSVILDLADGKPASVVFFRSIDSSDRQSQDPYLYYSDIDGCLVWASLPEGILSIDPIASPVGIKPEEIVVRKCQPRLI